MIENVSFAYYRLPYSDHYKVVRSERPPVQLSGGVSAVGWDSGFVIAPFVGDEVFVISPDEVETVELKYPNIDSVDTVDVDNPVSPQYERAFRAFHDEVVCGQFNKLVLARQRRVSLDGIGNDVEQLFLRACAMYPRLMVMLFRTPDTGTWLVASPEILVEGRGTAYHTIALAGTMPFDGGYTEWSEKNKSEQRVVERYIMESLTCHCTNVVVDGPVTMRAGNLVHLRSDFHFRMKEGVSLGMLIDDLHPTPAVCGMPKEMAREFIMRNEGFDRKCYSGFAGPVGIDGETHLYVSLRCAELFDDHCVLYAGGGIMPDSMCEQEWKETESKMKTIGNVLK